MSFLTMFVVGAISAFEFFYILYSFDKTIFLTVLGYKVYIDAIFGFGITAYMALSGTISGVVIAAISGLIFTGVLYVTHKVFGDRKWNSKEKKWVVTEPKWKLEDIKAKAKSLVSKFPHPSLPQGALPC